MWLLPYWTVLVELAGRMGRTWCKSVPPLRDHPSWADICPNPDTRQRGFEALLLALRKVTLRNHVMVAAEPITASRPSSSPSSSRLTHPPSRPWEGTLFASQQGVSSSLTRSWLDPPHAEPTLSTSQPQALRRGPPHARPGAVTHRPAMRASTLHFTETKAEARAVEHLTPSHTAHAAQRQSWKPHPPRSRWCSLSSSPGCRAPAAGHCAFLLHPPRLPVQMDAAKADRRPTPSCTPPGQAAPLTAQSAQCSIYTASMSQKSVLLEGGCHHPHPGKETEEEGVLLGNSVMDMLAGRGRSPWAKVRWARAGGGPALCYALETHDFIQPP
ncbi:uncharacterized protein LOC132497992 [Mesoplodon densirostris]|uniref:uncharacterized protein LOC132497992 n=1 Tax=Mesoplodon densirostris TaxID=48708 RepID=UPI0028DD313C|nr:uncharacterized protein LOC132497992 [Mesoplodon densirostris]